MERTKHEGREYEVRYYYFHRDLPKKIVRNGPKEDLEVTQFAKGVRPDETYPHGHFGYVVAASVVDRANMEVRVGFAFMRPNFPFSKQEKRFFRELATQRAFRSRVGYSAKFSGDSFAHVIDAFNQYPRDRRAGFARRMKLVDGRQFDHGDMVT